MPARTPEEIHALIAAALNAGDRDAFCELHEAGAVVALPPEGRRVTGRPAIRAAVETILALRPHVRIEVVDKLEADGLALTHGRWSLVGSAGDEPVRMSGRGTVVSRRQHDGSWQVVFDNPLSHA